jgi:hypothetical protein
MQSVGVVVVINISDHLWQIIIFVKPPLLVYKDSEEVVAGPSDGSAEGAPGKKENGRYNR